MTALEQNLLMLKHDVYDVQCRTRHIRDAATADIVSELAQTVENLIALLLEVESKRL